MPRIRCERCLRPQSHCLCHLIPCLPSRSRVLILQHPDEVGHALNTARFAALGLANAQLEVGETFPELERWLDPAYRACLLFPGETAQTLPLRATADDDRPLLLVVPDGTWRKARKLLYLNPLLSTLPCVSLPAGLNSRYRLRKAPGEGALATLEAIVAALELQEAPQRYDALLRPFEALIEGQIAAMGEEIFRRNHSGSVTSKEEP
ncbi:tRNA-uridine aminocarboxypropyltransferase [Pseudomonas sp. zbq_18]|uniref:tRNA-uridine aminocarboxypropyltransferase n=1 Tax=Pseudomonas sp. zbq_18 TaxID=3367251 RepID=UPI00370C8400